MLDFLQKIGNGVLDGFAFVGRYLFFQLIVFSRIPSIFKIRKYIFQQMEFFGVKSLGLVSITSVFTGMVTAVQAKYQMRDMLPLQYIGGGVGKAVLIELGPVLTALVIAGRVGAGIAAEIGTMRVTEQIDAMETLSLDPFEYICLSRMVAGFFMLPVLTIYANLIAIIGGLLVAHYFLGVPSATFIEGLRMLYMERDLYGGLIKTFIFGLIIAGMGTYFGYYTEGGAEGVGFSTTKAVVFSSVGILIMDFVVASLIF
ncbi:MAG: ABC transporter permease [Candidatus Coatesbacteria bacterium]|nr:ABC transporter permease [Candidatus Coatesbacteria bacterium]